MSPLVLEMCMGRFHNHKSIHLASKGLPAPGCDLDHDLDLSHGVLELPPLYPNPHHLGGEEAGFAYSRYGFFLFHVPDLMYGPVYKPENLGRQVKGGSGGEA